MITFFYRLEIIAFFYKLMYIYRWNIYIYFFFFFNQKFHIVAKKDTWNCLESHRFSYEVMNALNPIEPE